MDLNPPAGSEISIVYESGDPIVVIAPSSGLSRYFSGLFLLFWLGPWTIGFWRRSKNDPVRGNRQRVFGLLARRLDSWRYVRSLCGVPDAASVLA